MIVRNLLEKLGFLAPAVAPAASEDLVTSAQLENTLHDMDQEMTRIEASAARTRSSNLRIRQSIEKIRRPFAEFEGLMEGSHHGKHH